MSGRGRIARDRPLHGAVGGRKCIDCTKYSRKTLYCTKERRVTAEGKEACVFFVPRHQGKSTMKRKPKP